MAKRPVSSHVLGLLKKGKQSEDRSSAEKPIFDSGDNCSLPENLAAVELAFQSPPPAVFNPLPESSFWKLSEFETATFLYSLASDNRNGFLKDPFIFPLNEEQEDVLGVRPVESFPDLENYSGSEDLLL